MKKRRKSVYYARRAKAISNLLRKQKRILFGVVIGLAGVVVLSLVATLFFRRLHRRRKERGGKCHVSNDEKLNDRELSILRLMAEGKTTESHLI